VLPYVLVYPGLLTGLVYLLLSGSLLHIAHIAKIIIFISPKINPFALQYCSGPWFTYIIDYILLSPWTLLLCVGYLFTVLQNFPKSDLKDVYFATTCIVLLILLSFFTKSVRYFMILDVAIRLFALLMLYKMIPVKSERMKFIVAGGIVVILCINDFCTFYDMFIKRNLYDPTSYWLLKMRNIIP
jgi:hypothetical protein